MNETELIELQKEGYVFSATTSTALDGRAATQTDLGTLPLLLMYLTNTLRVESFAGINFRGYKLSRTPTFKIKFRGD